MARLAWLVSKEAATEDDKIIDLEDFLRSVLGSSKQGERATARARIELAPHDDIDDALEALDDDVLNEEPAPAEPEPAALDQPLHDEALREVPPPLEAGLPPLDDHSSVKAALPEAAVQLQREVAPPLEAPLPALDDRPSLKSAPPEAAVQLQPQSLVLGEDEDEDGTSREAPAFEPRPHQLDELLDEALSETFPASDPIAVSAAH